MHKLSIFLLVLFWSTAVIAQSGDGGKLGQLKHRLTETKDDTGRISALLALSHEYNALTNDHSQFKDTALTYARQAINLGDKYTYPKATGLGYQEAAVYYKRHLDFKQCKTYIDRATTIFQQNNLPREEAEAWLLHEEFYVGSGGQDMKVRIGYYEKARALFVKAGAIEREAATLKILGDFYQVQGNFEQALIYLRESLALFKKTKVKDLQGLYDLIANVSVMLGDHEGAVEYGLAALKTAEAMHDTTLQLCTIYNRLGITYYRMIQYQQSEFYCDKALKVALKYNDTATTVQVMLNYADAMVHLHKPLPALRLLKLSMEKYPTHYKELQLLTLTSLVSAYVELKQLRLAGIYCDKELALLESPPFIDPNIAMGIRLSAIKYYIATRQFELARKNLQIYSKGNSLLHVASTAITAAKFSYLIDSLQNKYADALDHFQYYTRLKDSVFNIKKTRQVEELKIQYETDKQEQNIQSLTKDSAFQREKTAQANRIRNLTLAGTALLAILLALIYVNYRAKQRTNTALNIIVAQKDDLLKEREWLIKEIHHRVKNNLQIVMGLLQRQSAYIDNAAALQAIQNSESRMHSIALIHQKLYQSENLDLINMPEYISDLVNCIRDGSDAGNRIRFEKDIDDVDLDVSQAVPLGLILNEAITNAVKYAYPNDTYGIIRVRLKRLAGKTVVLSIEDEGRGLPTDFDLEKVNSLGLNLMKGLSKQIEGVFEMKHQNGVGIQITFSVERFSCPDRTAINT